MQKNTLSERKIKKYGYYLFCLFLGAFLMFMFSMITSVFTKNIKLNLEDVKLILKFILIVIAGAFGGLLHSLHNQQPKVPNSLIGIGGALVVFLIVPGEIKQINIIELLGTALIGGYGGGSFLDQALDSIVKNQEELKSQIKTNNDEIIRTKKELEVAKKQLKENTEQVKIDANTLKLLSRYLDKTLKLSEAGKKELKNNINFVSATARAYIFEKTKTEFYKLRESSNEEISLDNNHYNEELLRKKLLINSLEIFKALSDSNKGESNDNDRYPAHEAYAYMELEEWEEAIQHLEEAKERLEIVTNKGENEQNKIIAFSSLMRYSN